jgi:hypothetical protein
MSQGRYFVRSPLSRSTVPRKPIIFLNKLSNDTPHYRFNEKKNTSVIYM